MSTDSTGVLAHHFNNIEQQQSTARLGMWMFLVTEALFFGGIFVAYTAYRIWYPQAFLAGSGKLNVLIGGINSVLLLTSSLTITLAIHAAHEGKQGALKELAAHYRGIGGRLPWLQGSRVLFGLRRAPDSGKTLPHADRGGGARQTKPR